MAPPDGGAMHDESPWDRGSAIHAALMTALTRFLLAATLLLLAGLLPAATLLLIRARVALLRLVRLWLVRVAHALSPQGLTGLPLGVNAWKRRKLRRKTSNARANFAQYRRQFPPKFRRELKTGHTRL
jgi:hypothetical protein